MYVYGQVSLLVCVCECGKVSLLISVFVCVSCQLLRVASLHMCVYVFTFVCATAV